MNQQEAQHSLKRSFIQILSGLIVCSLFSMGAIGFAAGGAWTKKGKMLTPAINLPK